MCMMFPREWWRRERVIKSWWASTSNKYLISNTANLQLEACDCLFAVLASLIYYSLSVSRHCTGSYWLEKLLWKEEPLKTFSKTDLGMVIMKLSMQSGHLSAHVALMMQVVLENWCQISYLGYSLCYHLLMFKLLDIQLSLTKLTDFPFKKKKLNCCYRLVQGTHILLFSIFLVWPTISMLVNQWMLVILWKLVLT